MTAVALASAAALTLAASETQAVQAAGTASSSLSAVTLTVTGIDLPSPITLLDAGTLATTDAAFPGNVVGAPWAQAQVAPLVVAGQAQGAVTARSDQGGSATAPATGVLGTSLAPIDVAASAGEGLARATIGATTGTLEIVPGLVSIGIQAAGVDSVVTGEQASNTQGLVVDGLEVSLGDLVPADLLAALPIDVLLDLLAALPVGAPNVDAVTAAATALVGDVRAGVDDIAATAGEITTVTAALQKAVTDLTDQQAIVNGLNVDLGAAQTAATNAAANATAAANALASALAGEVAAKAACVTNNPLDPVAAANCIAGVDAAIASARTASNTAAAAAAAATATVDQLTADLAAATSLLNGIADTVDALTDLVDALVADLVALLNALLDDLNALVAALTNLDASLSDVLDALLDTTLLGVGDVNISMSAVSTGSADTSTAGVTCSIGGLVVAGVDLGGGACDGSTLTGSLTGALDTVRTVLASLPVADAIAVPEVTIDLLDVATSITEGEDGAVTSTATVVPLVVDLPSVDVDPANIVAGLLDQLSGDLLGDLLAQLPLASTLTGLGLGDAAAALQTVTDTLSPALDAASAAVGDVLALLPDGSGLVAFSTPGFNLQVDPTSTATFRPAAAAPAPAPAPAPLPTTGGGALFLGVTGIAGAWALRRRR